MYAIDSYGWRDWEKKQNIVREMKFCADLMEEMFGETNHGEALQYRYDEFYFAFQKSFF